jgi:hypothetical protein
VVFSLSVFPRRKQNPPFGCRDIAISTPAKYLSSWVHRQRFGRRSRFLALQVPAASAPIVRILDAEAQAVEIANYFVELCDGYACSWCELNGNQLILIPSHNRERTFVKFVIRPKAGIVGRVTVVTMTLVESK